jgi:thioredoxin
MRIKFKSLIFAGLLLIGYSSCSAKTEKTASKPTATSQEDEHIAIQLNKTKFIEEIWDYENSPQEWKYKGSKPAIIDFYADWCGPCRMAAPILEEVANEYKDKIIVYKVNTQYQKELASVFGIKSIPAFLYIPMTGKPTMTSGTARTKEDTKKMFIQLINQVLLEKEK